MTRIPAPLLAAALAATLAAGCSHGSDRRATGGPPPAIRLTATLDSPVDITLRWVDHGPPAAGHLVEFATARRGPYTILGFLPAGQTSYTHPKLMPHTPFYYRVRPFYGPASSQVDVALPPGDFNENDPGDQDWARPRTVPPATPVSTAPVRTAAAAPTDLRGQVMDPNGIRFTWTDHAGDEQGYLLEVRPAGQPDFAEVAVFDRDVNSAGLVTLPDEKRASYRVRAYYTGGASNLAQRTTGGDPS
ncbi:MAG: fibronectin type III domain-containing protein [Mycobacteriales bacterium]